MWAAHEPASGRLHPNLDRSCVAHGYRAIRITDTRGLVARWPLTLTRTIPLSGSQDARVLVGAMQQRVIRPPLIPVTPAARCCFAPCEHTNTEP